MNFEEQFVSAVQTAVTPKESDVLVARGVILAALEREAGPVGVKEFEDQWLTANSSQRPDGRYKFTAIPATESGRRWADPDPNDAHLSLIRGRHAVRRALAQLIAEGVLTRTAGDQEGASSENLRVDYPGGNAGISVRLDSPLIESSYSNNSRFMPVRPAERDGSEVLLPVEELLSDLDLILGSRGMTMVRESRRALRQGLYLASSSLLAAASEAAWFNLARAVPSPPNALARKVGEGRDVAEVIRLTEQKLREIKPSPGNSTITEILTQAHMFREVRNYALHPVDDHDADRESWLTETGATLLTIAARRYFVKLADLRDRLSESE